MELRKGLWSTNHPDTQRKGFMADELAGSSQPLVQAEKETEPVVGAQGPVPVLPLPCGALRLAPVPKGTLYLHRLLPCANKCCHMAQGGSAWATELQPSRKGQQRHKHGAMVLPRSNKTLFSLLLQSLQRISLQPDTQLWTIANTL